MTDQATVVVQRIGREGDGIAVLDGQSLPVPGALPGDRVTVADGTVRSVETSGSGRRQTWLCPHAPRCGGCSTQHMSEPLYRSWKASIVSSALGPLAQPGVVQDMISVPHGSRRRAVLAARSGHGGLGLHVRGTHEVVAIERCAVLAEPILAELPALKGAAEALIAAGGELRLSVIATHQGLDVAVEGDLRPLRAEARGRLVGQMAHARVARMTVVGAPLLASVEPVVEIAGIAVVPPPGAFLQATAEAERAMQAIAVQATRKAKRVADLFAGLGTFTFALARHARVLAVDGSQPHVDALRAAARRGQGLKPIEAKVRDLFADPLSPRELDGFDAVLFDPPRAGASAQAAAIARSSVGTVVAVSCNPATLARDIEALVGGGFRLQQVTPIDQFLYTPHLEVVAVLDRPVKLRTVTPEDRTAVGVLKGEASR